MIALRHLTLLGLVLSLAACVDCHCPPGPAAGRHTTIIEPAPSAPAVVVPGRDD